MGARSRAVLFLTALCVATMSASTFDFGGRASGWLAATWDTSFLGQAGLRYLPEARLSAPIGGQFTLDAEASVNGFLSADARTFDRPEVEARIKPYRALVRVSSPQFEARVGLQKINFGSAMLLRPLMWFDRVDPRDPLELTDGVYGLLARYYFQNNINVWAWGLLGNSSPKGWEVHGSERWMPEPGMRVQVPLPRGEVAATYHRRAFSAELAYMPPGPRETLSATENRLGIDGKWDIGVGLWFEGTLSQQASDRRPDVWQRMSTIGLDYTFGIGSGLGVTVEHMLAGIAAEPFGRGTDAQLSALMLSYPIGLVDNLRGMAYYDWKDENLYRFLGWQRTLDSWVFSVGAFWNPEHAVAAVGGPAAGVAGRGVRLDIVFNH